MAAQSRSRWPWSRHLHQVDSGEEEEVVSEEIEAIEAVVAEVDLETAVAAEALVAAEEVEETMDNRQTFQPDLETGDAPQTIVETPTLHGEMSATSARHPSQKA